MGLSNNAAYPVVAYVIAMFWGLWSTIRFGGTIRQYGLAFSWQPSASKFESHSCWRFPCEVHGFPGFSIAVLEFIGEKQMVIWMSLLHFIVFCSSGWCLSVHMKVYVFFYSRNIYSYMGLPQTKHTDLRLWGQVQAIKVLMFHSSNLRLNILWQHKELR